MEQTTKTADLTGPPFLFLAVRFYLCGTLLRPSWNLTEA